MPGIFFSVPRFRMVIESRSGLYLQQISINRNRSLLACGDKLLIKDLFLLLSILGALNNGPAHDYPPFYSLRRDEVFPQNRQIPLPLRLVVSYEKSSQRLCLIFRQGAEWMLCP